MKNVGFVRVLLLQIITAAFGLAVLAIAILGLGILGLIFVGRELIKILQDAGFGLTNVALLVGSVVAIAVGTSLVFSQYGRSNNV